MFYASYESCVLYLNGASRDLDGQEIFNQIFFSNDIFGIKLLF